MHSTRTRPTALVSGGGSQIAKSANALWPHPGTDRPNSAQQTAERTTTTTTLNVSLTTSSLDHRPRDECRFWLLCNWTRPGDLNHLTGGGGIVDDGGSSQHEDASASIAGRGFFFAWRRVPVPISSSSLLYFLCGSFYAEC